MEEQPKRKPRIPLSQEELFYVVQLKKLKELERIQKFKSTRFYLFFNRANIILSAIVSYCILSILILTHWQSAVINKVSCNYGGYDPATQSRSIVEVHADYNDYEKISVQTSHLFVCPEINQPIYIGKDFIFGKIIKAKFSVASSTYWTVNSYASLSVCFFAMALSIFIYKVNKHLSVNGLLTVFGLFSLATLYFLCV
jgi:hypothetical protein